MKRYHHPHLQLQKLRQKQVTGPASHSGDCGTAARHIRDRTLGHEGPPGTLPAQWPLQRQHAQSRQGEAATWLGRSRRPFSGGFKSCLVGAKGPGGQPWLLRSHMALNPRQAVTSRLREARQAVLLSPSLKTGLVFLILCSKEGRVPIP